MRRSGGEPEVVSVGRDQTYEVAALPAGGDHTGGGRHGELERLWAVSAAADVEHDGDPSLPGQLVLPHHQLVPPCRGLPVHAAHVVADDVRPERVEVLTGTPERRRMIGTGMRIVSASVRYRNDVVDPGEHRQLGHR